MNDSLRDGKKRSDAFRVIELDSRQLIILLQFRTISLRFEKTYKFNMMMTNFIITVITTPLENALSIVRFPYYNI